MIIVMRPGAEAGDIERVRRAVQERGLQAFVSQGEERTVIGVVGREVERVRHVGFLPGVERLVRVTRPYKLASLESRQERTRVDVAGVGIGGGENLVVMAGPCAVESREQLDATARAVKREGAAILRGGAFKPRTSPYSFQGLGERALDYLARAGERTGMPVVCEVTDPRQLEPVARRVDLLQVGSRNMHNFDLLRALGASRKPVLLKRGFGATIEEWLLAAEHVLASGNPHVILCERGIRTFDPATRNTLDLTAVPLLRDRTHLPIVVDPSHGTGDRRLVGPMALAAAAVGADGLLIEVHPDPPRALSDGDQSLSFDEFGTLMDELRRLEFVRRKDPVPARGSGRQLPRREGGAEGQRSQPTPAVDAITVLSELRARIDEIDRRILDLVQERTAAALQVRRLRAPETHGHDVGRERELLARAADSGGPLSGEELRSVYLSILRSARAAQRRDARGEKVAARSVVSAPPP